MFENNNATFYGNSRCAVDDDLLLLPVLSDILKMYTVVYTPHSHFRSPTFKNITSVKFTSMLYRRTMSVAKPDNVDIAATTGNNYISGTMKDSVEIPTPSEFSMMTSSI